MDPKPGNHLLEIPRSAIEYVRKIYDLDKPGRLEDALKILTEWIQKQDHIIKKDFSNFYLERTLISGKGSIEKAKKQIERLCTMKTLVPRFFSKTNLKMELKHVTDIVRLIPLPKLTEDYYRILLIKSTNKSITPQTAMEYYQYNILLAEYLKAHDYFNGLIIIHDCRQINVMEIIKSLNTADLQQFLTIIGYGYGAKIKFSYIITDSNAIDLLIKIVHQFLSKKVGERVYVYKNPEDLQKVLPKEILPIEYGGYERSCDELFEEWVEELSSDKHVEYIKMMNKAGSDETKRHAGTFNEEYLGMPGSFRCLNVD